MSKGQRLTMHGRDHRWGGADRIVDPDWLYVGTVGLDGVDSLLTYQSPPFVNGWTNALGVQAPVSFLHTVAGWVHIRGGFFGGSDNTTIFTLPVGYRPEFTQPMVIPTSVAGHFATITVNTDGRVVYGTLV